MNSEQVLKEWENTVQGIERLRRHIAHKSDNRQVQEMIVRLLDAGEKISRRMKCRL